MLELQSNIKIRNNYQEIHIAYLTELRINETVTKIFDMFRPNILKKGDFLSVTS